VSVADFDDQYFRISFSTQSPGDDFDLSAPLQPYLLVQRQFDDGGVCYIETHDPDTCAGHSRLRLLQFKPTRLAFEIARTDHKYVELAYELDPFRIELPLQVNIGGRRFYFRLGFD
jgi:hypothetical protein